MMSIAEDSLRDCPVLPEKDGFQRFIRREPLGVIFVIAAWNYPYLIAVNGVVPAILAGNTVILKHAPQTFPCAERFAAAFKEAGLPDGVFQVRVQAMTCHATRILISYRVKYLHVDHRTAEQVIKNQLVSHVLFTGSVRGGREVCKIAADRFIGTHSTILCTNSRGVSAVRVQPVP